MKDKEMLHHDGIPIEGTIGIDSFSSAVTRLRRNIEWGDLYLANFTGLSTQDLELVLSWRNDSRVRKWMINQGIIPWTEHEQFVLDLSKNEGKGHYYLAYLRGITVGVISLTRVDTKNRTAHLGIYRDPNSPSVGTMEKVSSIFFKWFFDVLHFTALEVEVLESNHKALRFFERLGFIRERSLRKAEYRRCKFQDMTVLGLYREHFTMRKSHAEI